LALIIINKQDMKSLRYLKFSRFERLAFDFAFCCKNFRLMM